MMEASTLIEVLKTVPWSTKVIFITTEDIGFMTDTVTTYKGERRGLDGEIEEVLYIKLERGKK